MKPKWQLGRIRSLDISEEWELADPEILNCEVWLKVRKPAHGRGRTIDSGELMDGDRLHDFHQSSILYSAGDCLKPLSFPTNCIELLPTFAENVPLIPWEEFLASCQNSKVSQS